MTQSSSVLKTPPRPSFWYMAGWGQLLKIQVVPLKPSMVTFDPGMENNAVCRVGYIQQCSRVNGHKRDKKRHVCYQTSVGNQYKF